VFGSANFFAVRQDQALRSQAGSNAEAVRKAQKSRCRSSRSVAAWAEIESGFAAIYLRLTETYRERQCMHTSGAVYNDAITESTK
jgi:hypothetical protein